MGLKDLHNFSSDRPIENIEDDLLERKVFASALAKAIAGWHGRDSLVIALHGEWGAGKSSIKNMAVSQLKAEVKAEEEINVIEFSPWEWAAQEKINIAFFQEMSKSIGREDKSKSGKKLAAAIKKYGSYLHTGGVLVRGFSSVLPLIFTLTLLTGLSGSFSNETWVNTISIIMLLGFGVLAAILGWGKEFLYAISDNFNYGAQEKEQSLSEIREELSELLLERKAPLLVVLDDLDRLTSSQLRMVFQLIKVNLEFPNVVFLLLFQRDSVENKMGEDGLQSGRDYLEKIIQVPFDIPRIEESKVNSILFTKLDEILNQNESALKMFDHGRWGNIFYGALHKYFNNLRSVYRYTSTLSFHFNLYQGKFCFEVNPVDLIALECLRVFEPEVYKEIACSKEIFTMENGTGRNASQERELREEITRIIDKASTERKIAVEETVKQLFPTIEWLEGGVNYSRDSYNSWLRDMRVCHSANFDKYFQFAIPSNQLSNSDLRAMLELTSDTEKFTRFVLSLKERGIIKNALAQFESFTDEISLDSATPRSYITALLNIGDKIDNKSEGFTSFSSHTHVVRLVVLFLRRFDSLSKRGDVLLKCFKDSNGMSVIRSILQADENRRVKSGSAQILLGDAEFELLKKEFVKKINDISVNSSAELLEHEYLVHLLYGWKKWGAEAEVVAWVRAQAETAEGCISLLKKFISRSSSYGTGDYVATIERFVNLQELEDFVDISSVQKQLDVVNENELVSEELEALKLFREAIKKRDEEIMNGK